MIHYVALPLPLLPRAKPRGVPAPAAAVAAAEFPAAGFRLAASLGPSAEKEDLRTTQFVERCTVL
jgi:hypothetical protein